MRGGISRLRWWSAILRWWSAILRRRSAILRRWSAILRRRSAILRRWSAILRRWSAILRRWSAILRRLVMMVVVSRQTPAAERDITGCAIKRSAASCTELGSMTLFYSMPAKRAELEIISYHFAASCAGHSIRLRSRDLFTTEYAEFGFFGVFMFTFRTLHGVLLHRYVTIYSNKDVCG